MVFEQDVGSAGHVAYHQRRAGQELALAKRAADRAARQAHRDLAERHLALVKEQTPSLRIVRE